MTNLFWHHIPGPLFQLIVDSGVVLPVSIIKDETPACIWFARDLLWEKKANRPWSDHPTEKFYRLNRDESALRGLGRIGVGPEILPYNRWSFGRMLGRGIRVPVLPRVSEVTCWNSGVDSRISIEPIPITKWQTVQVWQDGTWIDVAFERIEL